MSHLVKKECALRDLQTLLEAAKALGWSVSENEKVKYYSAYGPVCEYVLHLESEVDDIGKALTYTIGIQMEGGKINLLHDNAMNGREVMYGDKMDTCTTRILNKLKQSYQIVAAQKVAQKKQWKVRELVPMPGSKRRVLEIEV